MWRVESGVVLSPAFCGDEIFLEVDFMKTSTGIILAVSGFVCGAVLGFILSPVKGGIKVGTLSFDCTAFSNNGTNNKTDRYGRKDEKKIESEAESDE